MENLEDVDRMSDFIPVHPHPTPTPPEEKQSVFGAQEDAWQAVWLEDDDYELTNWWDNFVAALKNRGWKYLP